MSIFDKFLNSINYKFQKGYPDINDNQDILLLESILENIMGEKIKLAEDASETKEQLKKIGYSEDDIKIQSKKVVKLLVPGKERMKVMDKVASELGATIDKNYRGSSIGAVVDDKGTAILVKPKEKQGGGSAGLENEAILVTKVNEAISSVENSIRVTFLGPNGSHSYKNITEAKSVGRDVKGGKKADVQLLSGDKVVANLSLKKNNAAMWESADKRYKGLLHQLITKIDAKKFPGVSLKPTDKKDIYHLHNPKTDKPISGILIKNLPNVDDEQIIFGTDNPPTVVIKQTFTDSDFKMDENRKILSIGCEAVYKNLGDVGDANKPVLLIRHDIGYFGTKGLRSVVFVRSHLYKDDAIKGNIVEIDYKDIIK